MRKRTTVDHQKLITKKSGMGGGKWLVSPAVIVLLLLAVMPIIYSLYVSTTQYTLTIPGSMDIGVGFANYKEALTDPEFLIAVWNTIRIGVPALICEIILGFSLALLLNRSFRGRGLVLALLVTPFMIAPGAASLAWRLLFDSRYGPINHLLSVILDKKVVIDWLGTSELAYVSLIIIDIWQTTPFIMLTLLAGLSSISPELYEAGKIDGASRSQLFRHITLQLIKPVLGVAIIFRSIDLVKMFDMCHALTKGGPAGTTTTLSYFIYRQGLAYGRVGYGAALSFIILIVVSLLASVYIRQTMKGGLT